MDLRGELRRIIEEAFKAGRRYGRIKLKMELQPHLGALRDHIARDPSTEPHLAAILAALESNE